MNLADSTTLIIKNPGKVVNYFGLTLYVPKGFKWLATDEDGSIWAYKHKPNNEFSSTSWSCELGEIIQVASVQEVEGWTYSRVKVKHLERVLP